MSSHRFLHTLFPPQISDSTLSDIAPLSMSFCGSEAVFDPIQGFCGCWSLCLEYPSPDLHLPTWTQIFTHLPPACHSELRSNITFSERPFPTPSYKLASTLLTPLCTTWFYFFLLAFTLFAICLNHVFSIFSNKNVSSMRKGPVSLLSFSLSHIFPAPLLRSCYFLFRHLQSVQCEKRNGRRRKGSRRGLDCK